MTLEKQLTPTEQQQMVNLEDSSLYINRELSWLEFNHRVLEEVQEPLTPALEKLKFASIFSSNLDEFFMVRVGGLFRVLEAGVDEVDASGRTTRQQLDEIAEKVRGLVTEQYQTIREDLLAQLQKAGILGKSRAGKPQTQAVSTAADPDEKAPMPASSWPRPTRMLSILLSNGRSKSKTVSESSRTPCSPGPSLIRCGMTGRGSSSTPIFYLSSARSISSKRISSGLAEKCLARSGSGFLLRKRSTRLKKPSLVKRPQSNSALKGKVGLQAKGRFPGWIF